MDKRHKIFFIIALAGLFLIIGRMLFLAGAGGERYRQEVIKTSEQTGELPAIRGRIYDRNGRLLAWSERCYDLIFKVDRYNASQHHAMIGDLKSSFKDIFLPENFHTRNTVLKRNLTAAEVEAADRLSLTYRALDVDLRWERRINAHHAQVGQVRQINGVETGISGWEKEYDSQLRGTPGTFSVMLDRHGNWVESTFRITRDAVDGQDVTVQITPGGEHNE